MMQMLLKDGSMERMMEEMMKEELEMEQEMQPFLMTTSHSTEAETTTHRTLRNFSYDTDLGRQMLFGV